MSGYLGMFGSAQAAANPQRALKLSAAEEAKRRQAAAQAEEANLLQRALELSAAEEAERKQRASAKRRQAAAQAASLAAASLAAAQAEANQIRMAIEESLAGRRAEGGSEANQIRMAIEASLAGRRAEASLAGRRAEGGSEAKQEEWALQASLAAAAEARRAATANSKRKFRRKSVSKGPAAADLARTLVGKADIGVYAVDIYTFVQRILNYSIPMILPGYIPNFFIEQYNHINEFTEFTPEKEHFECVGVILLFRLTKGINHFVPYIRINDYWYNGDDEKGILVIRENGKPTIQTKYVDIEGAVDNTSRILSATTFYFKRDEIKIRKQKDYTGTPVFGQSGLTCGPDASQTILMLADGFHSVFYDMIYKKLERDFNEKLSIWRPEVIEEDDLMREILKLNGILNKILNKNPFTENQEINQFILSMCIRYYSIENTPEETLDIINKNANVTE